MIAHPPTPALGLRYGALPGQVPTECTLTRPHGVAEDGFIAFHQRETRGTRWRGAPQVHSCPPLPACTQLKYNGVPRLSGHLKLSRVTETSGGRTALLPTPSQSWTLFLAEIGQFFFYLSHNKSSPTK